MSKDAAFQEQDVPVMTGVPDQSATITKVSRAINAVMKELESIVADAVIESGDATYASEVLVVQVVRAAMLKYKLAIVTDRVEAQQFPATTRSGCQVVIGGKLIHTTSGEWVRVGMAGYAQADSDKALAYAITAAYKTLLLRTFLIPIVSSKRPDGEIVSPGPATAAQRRKIAELLSHGPNQALAESVRKALEGDLSKVQASVWIKNLDSDLRRQAKKKSGVGDS